MMAIADIQDASALNQFPVLVWERILDSMDDGKDIENVLRTFPELDVLFHRKKTVWLFDQVLPHVLRRVAGMDIPKFLNLCRQPCQRWWSVTDNFVRDHPSRRPYNQDGVNRRTVPYREFSYDEDRYGRRIYLMTVEAIQDFHAAMLQHPNPDRPLKTFRISIVRDWNAIPEDYLNATLAFLQAFGKHILDVLLVFPDFYPEDVKSAKNTLRMILECLSSLPNVRKLFLNFRFLSRFSLNGIYNSKWSHNLPRLQHLETLELGWFVPLPFQRKLLKKYGLKIKKLDISTNYLGYGSLCGNNLVDLVISFRDDSFNDHSIQSTLRKCPRLKKLTLYIDLAVGGPRIEITVSALYRMLQQTQLEELDLEGCRIRKDCTCFFVDNFPSVKYLKLEDHRDQELDFLAAFPLLEHLQIEQDDDEHTFSDQSSDSADKICEICDLADKLADTVRVYVYKPVVSADVNIWDNIPSLKMLTVTQGESFHLRFARECGNKPLYAFLRKVVEDTDTESEAGSDENVDILNSDENESDEMSEADNHDAEMSSYYSDDEDGHRLSDKNDEEEIESDGKDCGNSEGIVASANDSE